MRKRLLLATVLLLPFAPRTTSAQVNLGCTRPAQLTSPFAFVSVNGQCADLSAFIVAQAKGWSLDTRATVGGATVDLRAIFNPDPFVTFSGTTVNAQAAGTTYSFLLGSPIVPDFYSQAIASVQFSATSVTGTTNVTNKGIYPTYLSGYGTLGVAATNLGVDAGTSPCVASGDAASTTCPAEQNSNAFAPAFYDNLEELITYSQDNALSTASFDATVTLEQVTATPEPSSLALLGSGLLIVVAYTSRRSARRRA